MSAPLRAMKWARWAVIAAAVLVAAPIAVLSWQALIDRYAPSPASTHIDRGQRALAQGRYADAVIAFGRARQMDPKSPEADLGFIRARVHGLAEEPPRPSDTVLTDEVRYEAELLLDRDPKSAAACHTALGHLAARKGDIAAAKAKYEEAIKVDAASAGAHTALGNIYLNDKERAAQAAPEFEAALKAKPGHPAALIGLAFVALSKNDLQEVVRRLTAALETRDDATAHLLLGNTQVRLKNLNEAIKHLDRAAQMEPRNTEALRSLGQALMAADRSAEAERPLRAAAQNQDDAEASTSLGFALARQRKHGAALEAFTQALGRDPVAPLALFGVGVSLEELGKRDDALIAYRRLLALKPPPGQEIVGLDQVKEDARKRIAVLEGAAPESPADKDAAGASAKKPARP